MKKLILLLLLSSFITTGQNVKETIYLKNGETKTGFVKLDDSGVKFKVHKKSKDKIKYLPNEVERVEFESENGIKTIYVYKNTERILENSPRLMNIILEGNVTLYEEFYTYGYSFETRYYVSKQNEKLTLIYKGLGNSSNKAIKNYFQDCPSFIELLNRQAFRKIVVMEKGNRIPLRLLKMVEYYNSKCSND